MAGQEYKLYSLNERGLIKGPAESIFEIDDEAAIETARAGQGMETIEIWCGARKVAALGARA